MTPPIPPSLRAALGSVLLALVVAAPASALTSELRILINVDVNPATGCDVTTVDGVFPGVEQILVTTVETSGTTGQVTLVERHECVDEATDTFGPAIPVSAGGWPVGVGLGLDGSDVVETFVGVSDIGGADPPPVIRLGVVGDNGMEQDALLVVRPVGNQPILLNLANILEIPTLSEWGLILLALLLAVLALGRMRRLRRRHAVTLLLLACLGTSVVAWASVRDGLIDDWLGISPLAEDPQADAPLGADLRALFARAVGGEICFRLDVFLAFSQPPTAVDDDFATDEDTVLNVAAPGVLANDSDPESDPLTVTAFDATSAQGAAVTVNADGSFSYDPTGAAALQALAQGDAVDDTFTYTIEDPDGGSDMATVTVTVDGVNDAPTAVGDNFATDEDTTLNAPAPGVLVNDSDPDTGDSLTAVLDTGPSNASSFTLNPDGSFDYTPVLNFNGDDTFTYHASDGTASSATVTVTVTVGPLPDGPMAVDDAFATDEDTSLNIAAPGVLNNDTDPENDPLQVTAFDAVSTQGATVSVAADGSFTYDPTGAANLQALAAGAMLDDTFTYTVEDNPSTGSDVGTVTVTVTGVDDPPTAVNDTATVTEDDPATTIDVLANDTDLDGGTKEIIGITQPTNGTVVNNTTDLTYQPDPDYCNDGSPTDDFTYTITGGSMATVSVTVTCVSDPPMVVGETFDVAAGNFDPAIGNTTLQFANTDTVTTPHVFVSGDVLDNDSDPESDPLSITAFQNPSTQGGTVVMNLATGEFTYLPPVGFEGVDTFTYTVFDGTTGVMGTVTIEVADMVWYLDNDPANDGSGDDGRSSSPFDSIAQFEAENGGGAADDPEAGDVIFIFQGTSTYDAGGGDTDGLDLLDQQKLLGEGVDLVVQSLTLVSGNPANQPSIDNTNMGGDAVTVLADAADRTGIEIRGLSISGDDNAVEVTSANTFQVGATISDNTIAGSGMEGIDLNPGSSGAFVVTLENNVFSTASAAGTAIDLTTTGAAGDVEIALNANTDVTSSTSAGIVLDNSGGGGKLLITGFAGNTVHGNTVGDGIRILAATFDADPTDADFTGDEVSGGNTSVGSGGNPVGGSAMVLTNVAGDLAFGTLDLFTNGMGAVGLAATGNGTLNAGAGTGFEITNTGGTINSSNGPAVNLDPLTAGLTFGSVSSGNSAVHGIRLHDVAGSFTATGGTLANSIGSAIRVTGTNPGDSTVVVSLSGMTVNHAAGVTPVIFGQNSTGLFSLTGSTISKGGGRVIEFDDMDGGSDFTGTTVNTTNHHGKRIIDSAGVHNLPNIQINTAPPAGVDALHLANNTGTFNVLRLEVTTNGSRGIFANNGGTLNVTGATNQITTTGHSAIEMSNTSVGTNGMSFASLSASSTGANEGLDLDGVGGGTFQVTGTTTVNGTGAGQSAIDIATSGATFTFNSINVDNPGGAGVALTNNTGPVTISGGDISGSAGNAFDVNQGAANVTYAGTINNGAARAVEVTNRTGGTVSFGGAIVDSGASNSGIFLDNNDSGTVQFTSTVDITGTSGAGVTFQNSNGGTASFADLDIDNSAVNQTALFATGNTGGGTLNTTTGTVHGGTASAADLDTTVLGVNLFSATSVGGAPVGIDLASTTGSFTVTGNGATGGAGLFADNNGSGGAITGKTGNGVRLATATNVSLNYMNINSNLGNGIHGTNVNGFVLTRTNLAGNGDAVDESGLRFGLPDGSQNGLIGSGLAGANPTRISHVDISAASEHNVEIINTGGVLTDLLVENSRFRDTNTSLLGADGFLAEMRSTAVGTINVVGSTFTGNATQGLQGAAIDSSSLQVNVTASTFDNNNEGLVLSTSGGGDLTFDISNNLAFINHDGVAIFVGTTSSATAASVVTGRIANNANIQTPGTGVNHSVIVFPSGNSKAVVLVEGNVITNNGFFRGINVTTTDNVGDMPDLDVTITNNTVVNGATADHAILVEGRNSAAVCAKIENNAASAVSATKFGIRLRERDSSTVELEQGGSASGVPVTVLSDNNPASAGFSVTGAPAVVANSTCEQVP